MSIFLHIQDENGKVQKLELTSESYVIGRSATADIQLDRPTVSRGHARLTKEAGKWTIADMGSRGGTRVNGQPVDKQALLPGDQIQISKFLLEVIDDSARHAIEVMTDVSWAPEDGSPSISTLIQGTGPLPKVDLSHIAALNEFGRSLEDNEDPDARLQALCDLVAGGVFAGNWAVALELGPDDAERPPRILAAGPADLIKKQDVHLSRTTIQAMRRSGAPVLASNFSEGQGLVEMTIVNDGPAAAVFACPLELSDDRCRLLYVNVPPQIASTEWLAVVSLAAKEYLQAENAWQQRAEARHRAAIERDLDNARTIQMSILPDEPDIDALDIAWSFKPCEAVGGDLIDILPMPDGKVMFTIADVSGHGLPAALATLTVHSVVQTCVKSGMPAERVMHTLNEHLCAYLPEGRFVSGIAVVADIQTGQTQCINAGHPPPLVVNAQGEVRELAFADLMVMGVTDFEMSAESDQLDPGDALLLYTDGLSEMVQASGEMIRIDGLKRLLGQVRSAAESTGGIKDAFCARLDELKGPQPDLDDQTFLMVARR